jgi:hypothetical protein
LLACVLVVLGSATSYFSALAPEGDGLVSADGKLIASAADALYFSVVTFTSLGYGDIAPHGSARIVASFVVLSGLFLVAVFVGKVASERQYSMLLLLHTSDCQRRLNGFASDLEILRAQMQNACNQQDSATLRRVTKTLAAKLEVISNYLFFHANQTNLAEFGNESSLAALYSELHLVLRACVGAYKTTCADEVICARSYAIVLRLPAMVRLMTLFHRDALGPHSLTLRAINALWGALTRRHVAIGEVTGSTTLEKMRIEADALKLWARTNETASLLQKVLQSVPSGPMAEWPRHVHKPIAAQLGVSNRLVQQCIDHLVADRRLPK